jgi:hypothetical protein
MAAPMAFRATPIENRGFRPLHDPSGNPFGATPIEDPGFWPIRKPLAIFHDPSGKPFGATPIEDPGFPSASQPLAISYQPSAINRLPFSCYQLSTRPLAISCFHLSAISRQLQILTIRHKLLSALAISHSAISHYQLSAIYQPLAISNQPIAISYQPLAISYQPSAAAISHKPSVAISSSH